MIANIVIILATVFLMYYRSLDYGYIIDDEDKVTNVAKFKPKNKLQYIYWHYKGVIYADNRLAHLFNILVHMSVCSLIYMVFGHNNLSFLTAMLFAVNPVNNQVSVWLAGKHYGVATGLALLAYWLVPLSPVFFYMALYTSTNVIFFPLIFLFKYPIITVILLPIIYLLRRRFAPVIKDRINVSTDSMTGFNAWKIILYFKTLGYYFVHCLFPIHIGMFHEYLHTYGLTDTETKSWHKVDRFFFIGIALILYTLYSIVYVQDITTFGLVWFILFSSQWCNVLMLNHPITERYIYFPNVGLMLALSSLIINTPLVYIFMTAYIVRLYYFLPAYRNMATYWRSQIREFPNVALGYNQLGLALLNFGNHGSALDEWIQGVQRRDNDFRLNYNLSNILIGSGHIEPGVKFLKKAEENLSDKNEREFWQDKINILKDAAREKGATI